MYHATTSPINTEQEAKKLYEQLLQESHHSIQKTSIGHDTFWLFHSTHPLEQAEHKIAMAFSHGSAHREPLTQRTQLPEQTRHYFYCPEDSILGRREQDHRLNLTSFAYLPTYENFKGGTILDYFTRKDDTITEDQIRKVVSKGVLAQKVKTFSQNQDIPSGIRVELVKLHKAETELDLGYQNNTASYPWPERNTNLEAWSFPRIDIVVSRNRFNITGLPISPFIKISHRSQALAELGYTDIFNVQCRANLGLLGAGLDAYVHTAPGIAHIRFNNAERAKQFAGQLKGPSVTSLATIYSEPVVRNMLKKT